MKYFFSAMGLAALACVVTGCGGSTSTVDGDGSEILITRETKESRAVYILSPTGETLQQLTDGTQFDRAPRWSPDGTRIACFRHIKELIPNQTEVYQHSQTVCLMNADGSNPQNLTPVVPDGSDVPHHPTWLNNNTLAFRFAGVGGAGLVTWSVSTGERKTLTTPDPTVNFYTDEFPSFSPSGTTLAFVRMHPGGGATFGELYLANADGAGARSVVTELSPEAAAWSPDGKRLAFVKQVGWNWRKRQIYVANADGSNPQQLTNNDAGDFAPVWSPDGKEIIFASARDGNDEIYRMNADGSNQVRLTNNDTSDIPYGWR